MIKNLKRKLDLFKRNSAIVRLSRIGITSRNNEIDLLKKQIKQWEQVNDIIAKKIKDEVDRKLWSYISGSGLVLTSSFSNYQEKQEKQNKEVTFNLTKMQENIQLLQEQAKATDKVFLLADKIERLLTKLDK